MAKGSGRGGGGRLQAPQSRHTGHSDATAHADRPPGSAADPIAAHVRTHDRRVGHPERIRAPRLVTVDGRPARPPLHAVRGRVHELRPRCDTPADGVRDCGSFRWVICTLTRFLLDRLVYFNIFIIIIVVVVTLVN